MQLAMENRSIDAMAGSRPASMAPVFSTGGNPLAEMGNRLRLARNVEIYAEGDAADRLYKVISGTVRCCKILADGRRHISEFLFAGDFFGMEARSEHRYTAEAVGDAVVMAYPRSRFERLVEQDLRFSRWLREQAIANLDRAHARMLLLGCKTASERVISFLLDLAERTDCDELLELPMSRYDIADYLGLTTETISRELSKLKHAEMIAVKGQGQRIELLDRKTLGEMATTD
jgi:CRP/FNR family nitrogen fixation transcriptional regulator